MVEHYPIHHDTQVVTSEIHLLKIISAVATEPYDFVSEVCGCLFELSSTIELSGKKP
jgi:hypothetical protein